MKKCLLAFPILMLGFAAQASETLHSHTSKYAGQEQRAIKGLSQNDIAELKRGGGMGLAKAAELNGVPGPAHLLGMKDEIPLDDAQVSAITKIFDRMNARAVKQGEKIIALEQELENNFQNRTVTDATLRLSLDTIAEARKELRYIHLATHLKTPEVISENQIKTYNALRGYADPDPCANRPEKNTVETRHKPDGCE